mmetsp:Transcript_4353/g.13577  ORF Transcript_4353/g.13577 Transcript_4353/m.13577 type:complete len:96 (-) Transcript_4353:1176-1463(-)
MIAAKSSHGDEFEISRGQKIDLTKLVLFAGRYAPRRQSTPAWRNSRSPDAALFCARSLSPSVEWSRLRLGLRVPGRRLRRPLCRWRHGRSDRFLR